MLKYDAKADVYSAAVTFYELFEEDALIGRMRRVPNSAGATTRLATPPPHAALLALQATASSTSPSWARRRRTSASRRR